MKRIRHFWQGVWTASCLLSILLGAASVAEAQVPILGKLFSKASGTNPTGDLKLMEEHGPWLIMAASFGGEEGVEQARQLAIELRRDHNLSAYVYSDKYDYTGQQRTAIPGKRAKYANSTKYDATVVLVGEYSHAEDERARIVLEKLKYLNPSALDYSKTGKTSQRFATLRSYAQRLAGEEKKKGLMSNAFVTRNPLLPDDYFNSAPVVDTFVRGLNAQVEHSLLACKGKFTVVVATFEGASAIDIGKGGKDSKLESASDLLDNAADRAHRLTTWLRKEKVEAFEFHDRYRSIVTVGSFEQLGSANADGRFVYDPRIFDTMQKYSASNGMQSQAKGLQVNGRGDIPFDFEPAPIAVPKTDKSAIYKGSWLSKN